MSTTDRMSIGRILLFGLIIAAFFTVIHQAVSFLVGVLVKTVDIVGDVVGEPNIMSSLQSFAVSVASWIAKVLSNPIGFAVIIVIAILYIVVTER